MPGPHFGGGFGSGMSGPGLSPWDPSARAWGGGSPWASAFPPPAYPQGMATHQPYPMPMPYQVPMQVPMQVPVPVQIPVPVHLPIPLPIPYAANVVGTPPTHNTADSRRDGNVSPSG